MSVKPLTRFHVYPRLPDTLSPLTTLAYNIKWCWDHEIIALFRRMDMALWEETRQNPIKLLGMISQERLQILAADESFVAHMRRAMEIMKQYHDSTTWYDKQYPSNGLGCIAYFSMEFGLTESIPNYSGGLGVLAGDHLKSSSDLGIPLVGMGLLYQQGYFRQYLTVDGWQQELYPENDFYNMPMQREREENGSVRIVGVQIDGREVYAQIWRVDVGRVPLYLLDTNIAENSVQDRAITRQLYGGDAEMRIQQELILGVGGIRALHAVGYVPDVCHMNEGHSAFMALERIRNVMATHDCSFAEALTATRAGNIFTTHTPVPAGIDVFSQTLVEKYMTPYAAELGISVKEIIALGSSAEDEKKNTLNMALLALHTSDAANGVSKLHGKVARAMWQYDWPDVPKEEIPISSVTNGIHIPTWISHEMTDLYERYLAVEWQKDPSREDIWEKIDDIPDGELWRTHERRRERLVAFARQKIVTQYHQRGMPDSDVAMVREALLPSALTIGFARRFATYKRATLLLQDRARLIRILSNTEYPVQIILAGKAHPHDTEGKKLIREIIHFAQEAGLRQRIVFLEDYDMTVARALVQGVDVWLNTPRRPLEASGTSGMKVVANGGLNLSVLDGWWDEGYERGRGWAIGHGEEYSDSAEQDKIEAEELYNILENEIVPLFYRRGTDMVPREWVAIMKESMKTLCPCFNTGRMVQDYCESFYMPAHQRYATLTAEKCSRARDLTAWCDKVTRAWKDISIVSVEADLTARVHVQEEITVRAEVQLGKLHDDDVDVQIYLGAVTAQDALRDAQAISMTCQESRKDGIHVYTGNVHCDMSGLHGYALRVLPRHKDMMNPYSLKLITWQI